MGHIKDLCRKSKLGVDVENGFAPSYTTVKGKKEIIDRLKKLAATSKEIFLATDPDREGEAIAYHLAAEVSPKNANIKRVLFTEITKNGYHRSDEGIRAASIRRSSMPSKRGV